MQPESRRRGFTLLRGDPVRPRRHPPVTRRVLRPEHSPDANLLPWSNISKRISGTLTRIKAVKEGADVAIESSFSSRV